MDNMQNKFVIYVEDDEDDQELCRMALEGSDQGVNLQFLNDGRSALDYFDKISKDDTRKSWPQLVILDLSMPAIDGWDLLAAFRSYTSLRGIPLIIFTTSNSPRDRARALAEGANAYMVKPTGLSELTEYLNVTMTYWLKIVAPDNPL